MGNLAVSGVLAGDGNGRPNVIELYALAADSSERYDLTFFGSPNSDFDEGIGCCRPIDSSGNFPNSVAPGDFYYITDDPTAFTNFFGFDADYTSQTITDAFATSGSPFGEVAFDIVIDDASPGGDISDNYGDSTTSWFYNGGWAYRIDGTAGSPGQNDDFILSDWTIVPNALDTGCPTNDACTCANPFPLGTYNTGTSRPPNPPCPVTASSVITTVIADLNGALAEGNIAGVSKAIAFLDKAILDLADNDLDKTLLEAATANEALKCSSGPAPEVIDACIKLSDAVARINAEIKTSLESNASSAAELFGGRNRNLRSINEEEDKGGLY